MSEKVRIGIIGTGGIAEARHIPSLRQLGDKVEIVGVMDIDRQRAEDSAQRSGIPGVYSSVEELLESGRPQIVHICTPPSTHVALAEQVLRAGVWVLVEKPPCLTLAEYDRIEAAARAGGAQFSVVFQHRFGSGGVHAAQLLASGELGRPLVAVCNTLWYRAPSYYDLPWRGRWQTEGGGPTMGHGIHQMDLLLALLGDWKEVTALAGRLDRDIETEDVTMASVVFENGTMASIVNSILSPREESYIRIDTTDATVELSHTYGYENSNWSYTAAPHVTDAARVAAWSQPAGDERSSHALQFRAVVDAYLAGEVPPVTGQAGRQALELIAGIYQSAFTGRVVRRGELAPGSPYYDSMNAGRFGWGEGLAEPRAGLEEAAVA
ncbi:Gfo/Idh/MocA family protein [Gryllotalpicola protaetiae]|uniref:Gfo/Idh/MocA family oxidoreductase n=1 Tax=Gryllotalpicola protaetiae TaxID=2419771 RepID=A0A387BP18_9MICO|nr:Gfo/Idh/MocA family oxidoreductase [Gryllotalpicola protaetiae]AYG03784.1 gfo/Idh/MocA family oxidoreductase [Gryllotalpicola protaetiae]